MVNTDVAALLQYWNNIKTAIASIDATRSSISKSYQMLGYDWKDKKYNDLGNIVQECCKALNDILRILSGAEKFVGSLAQSIQDYENISFDNVTSRANETSSNNNSSHEFGFNGVQNVFASIFHGQQNIYDALAGVQNKPIMPSLTERSEQQIISSISGGDMTEGSCSSLALAYAGNRAGYVVYDFRDGRSRDVFSSRSSIEQIASLDGVMSIVVQGADDTICAEQLMSHMEQGREYYMATGAHAAIVRLNDEGLYQYLELQSGIPNENGWHLLTLERLCNRFGCVDGQSREYSNFLIELDSLQQNNEFLNLLGYINTDEYAQVRGDSGHVR